MISQGESLPCPTVVSLFQKDALFSAAGVPYTNETKDVTPLCVIFVSTKLGEYSKIVISESSFQNKESPPLRPTGGTEK